MISGKGIGSTTLSPFPSPFEIMELQALKILSNIFRNINPVQRTPPNLPREHGEVKKQAGMQKIRVIFHGSSNACFITDLGCSLQVSIPTPWLPGCSRDPDKPTGCHIPQPS